MNIHLYTYHTAFKANLKFTKNFFFYFLILLVCLFIFYFFLFSFVLFIIFCLVYKYIYYFCEDINPPCIAKLATSALPLGCIMEDLVYCFYSSELFYDQIILIKKSSIIKID